jgi:hypothetical protein
MSQMTLELIASINQTYGEARSISLELVNHVHQRVEQFRYLDDIKPVAVALDYMENQELDSWVHLQIANRTYGIPTNSDKNAEVRKEWVVSTSTSLSAEYKDILVTNRTGVDTYGELRPLFYRHALPTGVVECNLEVVRRGNVQKVDGGYEVSLDDKSIYTNFENFFDPDTGAYTLFYVTCTQDDGSTVHQLLNPVPSAKPATWEDIDLDTGKLTTAYPTYSSERNASGYTFYMNQGDTWYWRPVEGSLIQPRLPAGRDPEDPWHLRFSAGDLSALVNGRVRRYYVPEFDQQNYSPSKPYIYSPYGRLLWVNDRVLAATRKNIAIDPEAGLHIHIFVSDFENNLIRVLTTDASLQGVRFSDTDVFYEADQIRSYDNAGGFISLNTKLHASHQIAAQYYYEADDYEYTRQDMNPLMNSDVGDKMVVFYMVPDCDPDDRAIHHLVVDQEGVIRECSQSLGFSYPNFQLFEVDGSVNTGSVIGLKYVSDIETDTFLTRYTAGYQNDFGYGILAEVVVLDLDDVQDMKVYDVRAEGGRLRDAQQASALRANPRILQSAAGYGPDGQEVPKHKVMLLEAPLSMRDDYGGKLPKALAEELLTRHLDGSCYPVIDWTYPAPDLVAQSVSFPDVQLTWTWEGPGLTYRVYRRTNPVGEWLEIYSVAGGASPASMSYTDADVDAHDVAYYTVRVEETINGEAVLYPRTHQVAVKVVL